MRLTKRRNPLARHCQAACQQRTANDALCEHTRGSTALGFSDAALTGLARDGGLYVPQEWPQFSTAEIRDMRGLAYPDLAIRLLTPFLGGQNRGRRVREAGARSLCHLPPCATCPLVQIGPNGFVLELFHGPTLAFKDVAMQLLARLMDMVLAERGQHATIVGAHFRRHRGAAIEAFGGRERTDVFILFPHGRVSPVQQRQMTTSPPETCIRWHRGQFRRCQGLLKDMFNDHTFRDRIALSGVNSINWARIMAQIVYYFSSALSLGAPDRPVSFTVPTGNFGDIFAGYAAKRMGLPVERLVIATNDNDILARTLASGEYRMKEVVATTSPSMDIQISSNFERLLFEAAGRDAAAVRRYMGALKQSGAFTIEPAALERIRAEFDAGRATSDEAAQTIRETWSGSGYLLDPHTATGLHVAAGRPAGATPMVVLGTAHPAKFPAAVEAASGVNPALPGRLAAMMQAQERFTVLPSDLKMVEDHISRRSRAAR